MRKLDITIYDLFGEKNDSGYVLVDAKKTNEYINLAKTLQAEHEALKLKHAKVTELLGLYEKLLKYIGLYNASTYCSKETLNDLKQKVKDTQKQIDTLEKELGEMK